jgi:hypothetical protein
MPDVLSFYAKDFSVCFGFYPNNVLSGIFISKGGDLIQHPFQGLYRKDEATIEVSFFVEWNLKDKKAKSYSAFSGIIKPDGHSQNINLQWLFVFDDGTGELQSTYSRDVFALSSNTNEDVDFKQVPFPSLDRIISDPEFKLNFPN